MFTASLLQCQETAGFWMPFKRLSFKPQHPGLGLSHKAQVVPEWGATLALQASYLLHPEKAQKLLPIGPWGVLYHFCIESDVGRRLGRQGPCLMQFRVPQICLVQY